jgi:putative flavoprotein involved in K+ transport
VITTGTVVIGAGQAGLAMSHCLTDAGHDHVVLDRGRVAERWHSERWDSLRLLTPNWMTRLPGHRYQGVDPDGYMTAAETVDFFRSYAASFEAPIVEQAEVIELRADDRGFVTTSTAGSFTSANVVIATGWCDVPVIPRGARDLSPSVAPIVPSAYRRPDQLDDGGVLVVGASATGMQLAHELRSSGRDVVMAVGAHHPMPRTYRGMDSFWWLDRLGFFDRTIDEVGDLRAARSEGSLQLVGRPDRRTLDLASLQDAGVTLTGRFVGGHDTCVELAPDLEMSLADADERLRRLLDRIDVAIDRHGLTAEFPATERPRSIIASTAPTRLDLRRAGIRSIVWATGYRRTYPWLRLPLLDDHGEIRQRRGATPMPGAYVLGQRFQHFRNSNFIDGVGRDAAHVAELITRSHRPLSSITTTA